MNEGDVPVVPKLVKGRFDSDGKGMIVLPPGTPPPPTVLAPPRAPKPTVEATAVLAHFKMPNPVKVAGRSSSITNSFVNSIIPVVPPTADEIAEALTILGMHEKPECAYCGDPFTEWDHLRPLIVASKPTGYVSEIHNLVPACGKCNQSKGNKPWRTWMVGTAALSPASRGIADISERMARLEAYEAWKPPTKLDFAAIVGEAAWEQHEQNRLQIIALMREADKHGATFRAAIAEAYLASKAEG